MADRTDFEDFTTATGVERAARDLALWVSHRGEAAPHKGSNGENVYEISLHGRSYKVESVNGLLGEIMDSGDAAVENTMEDFPVVAAPLTRWFGIDRFWLISGLQPDQEVSPSEAQTLLSVVVMALTGHSSVQRGSRSSDGAGVEQPAGKVGSSPGVGTASAARLAAGGDRTAMPVLVNVYERGSGTAMGYAMFTFDYGSGAGPVSRLLRFDSDSLVAIPRGYSQLDDIYARFQELASQHAASFGVIDAPEVPTSLAVQHAFVRAIADLIEPDMSAAPWNSQGVSSDESSDGDDVDSERHTIDSSPMDAMCTNSYAAFHHLVGSSLDDVCLHQYFSYPRFSPRTAVPMFLPSEARAWRLVLSHDDETTNIFASDLQALPSLSASLLRLRMAWRKAMRYPTIADILGASPMPRPTVRRRPSNDGGDHDDCNQSSDNDTEHPEHGDSDVDAEDNSEASTVGAPGAFSSVLTEIQSISDAETAISSMLDQTFATYNDDAPALGEGGVGEDVVHILDDLPERLRAAPFQSTLARLVIRAVLSESPERSDLASLMRAWRETTRRFRYHWEHRIPFRFERLAGPDDTLAINLRFCELQQNAELLQICIAVAAEAESQPSAEAEQLPLNDCRRERFADHCQTYDQSTPLWIPVTQRPPPMTTAMIDEQQTMLERLGTSNEARTSRAQVQSTLLDSDMSAFKAANPGCSLEDFVRWHSPRDWIVDDASPNGRMSARFAPAQVDPADLPAERALWHEAWETAEPLPAVRQRPLFNIEQTAEKALHFMSTLTPGDLMYQLLTCTITVSVFLLADAIATAAHEWTFPPPANLQEQMKTLHDACANVDTVHDQHGIDSSDATMSAVLQAFLVAERATCRWVSICRLLNDERQAHVLESSIKARDHSMHETAVTIAHDLFLHGRASIPKSFRPFVRRLFVRGSEQPNSREMLLRSKEPGLPTRLYVLMATNEFRVATLTGC